MHTKFISLEIMVSRKLSMGRHFSFFEDECLSNFRSDFNQFEEVDVGASSPFEQLSSSTLVLLIDLAQSLLLQLKANFGCNLV